jgi:DNA-binding transcriptional LysR family regulator
MTVSLYMFPPLLKHLKKVHPELDVRLTVATAIRSVEEMRAGRVDAGLLTLPVEESDLVTVPVLREELLLVTMPTHPLAKKKRVMPQDLAGEPFVLFEAGSATRRSSMRFSDRKDRADRRHDTGERRDHRRWSSTGRRIVP